MPDSAKRIGIAPDHEGFESKHLKGMLLAAHYEAVDHGDSQPKPDDDYPDFVVPLARARLLAEKWVAAWPFAGNRSKYFAKHNSAAWSVTNVV
jgi:hypothetical protein